MQQKCPGLDLDLAGSVIDWPSESVIQDCGSGSNKYLRIRNIGFRFALIFLRILNQIQNDTSKDKIITIMSSEKIHRVLFSFMLSP
jgi:hypothetical protein